MALEKTVYIGPFIQCESLNELEICPQGIIGVDENGKIVYVARDMKGRPLPALEGWEHAKVVHTERHGFFFPGFIGMHYTHACAQEIDSMQIRIYTHRNTPMLASLVNRPYLTG